MDAGASPPSSSSSSPALTSERAKIFVGGIPLDTTNSDLRAPFERFGEVSEAVAVRDRFTSRGRGFGFVLFADPAAADRAVEAAGLNVRGRMVEVKRAIPRAGKYHVVQQQHQYSNHAKHYNGGLSDSNIDSYSGSESRLKKVFVGGLPSNLTEDDFRKYFEKFGIINDVVVMYDNVTRRPRGFGFITFDSEEAVQKVMQRSHHELNGKVVEVKRAVPKDGSNSKHNGSDYNLRMNNSRGTAYDFQSEISPTLRPRYGFFPSYPSPPYSGYAYAAGGYPGVYASGGYNGMSYGTAFGNPRSPWHVMSPVRSPLLYGNASLYYSYYNNGSGTYMSMAGEVYPRIVETDNGNNSGVHTAKIKEIDSTMQPQVQGGTSDTP